MDASEVATLIRKLRPPLLDGLAPVEVSAVLAAARHRRLLANSVMTNQEHPAKDLFMILTGCARSFFLTKADKNCTSSRTHQGRYSESWRCCRNLVCVL